MRDNRILLAGLTALLAMAPVVAGQALGRAEPSFAQPSRAPGVDYVLPSESDIKATLDRIRDYFVRTTPYRIIDTETGAPITDLVNPTKAAGIEREPDLLVRSDGGVNIGGIDADVHEAPADTASTRSGGPRGP
jgi:hypothetical protein